MMRWAMVAVVAMGLSGCAVVVEFPEPLNDEVGAPAGADDAQAFVISAWSDRLGMSLMSLDDPPTVRWFGRAPDGSRCLKYDDGGPPVDGCMAGATPMVGGGGPYQIHLIAYGERASASAIVHEHLHWALDLTTGDNDYHHELQVWGDAHVLEDELEAGGM